MSHFLDRLMFFTLNREPFAEGHGEMRKEDRKWEEGYRARWQHDKSASCGGAPTCFISLS